MLAIGQIIDSQYCGKQSMPITGKDFILILDRNNCERKISEQQAKLPAEVSRRESHDDEVRSFEACVA